MAGIKPGWHSSAPPAAPIAMGWGSRLGEAANAAELVRVAKDFLAELSPEELRSLPKSCWPGRLVDADDIARYAVELARAQLQPGRDASPVLDRLVRFFAAASLRAAQVSLKTQENSVD